MSVFSGTKYSMVWKSCDLDGWSLRTRRGSLASFRPSPIDWPKSVMWDRLGFSVQPPLGPAIDENDGSSLLPTPTVGASTSTPDEWMARKVVANRGHASTVTDLNVIVTGCLLPSPVAQQSGKTAESHLGAKNRADGGNRVTVTDLQVLLKECLLPSSPACQTAPSETTASPSDDTPPPWADPSLGPWWEGT